MNMIDKDSVRVQAGASAPFTCATGIPARGGTNCTGDTIQGTPVISQLDVQDLEPGKKHRFFFPGCADGHGPALVRARRRGEGGSRREADPTDRRRAWR